MGKYDDDALDDVKACIVDKKNPTKCIDKVMEEYDYDDGDKAKILTKIAKEEME